ncbi:hypothetical protein J4772_04815 [Cohnella sp. LGH]|nr:hypothetical protein [Cohnella sp. LGH]QTH43751.1 hypothetical protein J4772_04815 [Cohnella sp. LGH]
MWTKLSTAHVHNVDISAKALVRKRSLMRGAGDEFFTAFLWIVWAM